MQKSISLSLIFTVIVWLAMRDFLPVPLDDEEDYPGAAALNDASPDDQIEALSRVIDRQTSDPQSAERLAATYRLRGSFRLQKQEPQKALADFDAALQLNPDALVAQIGRAECYRQLGDPDRADAEMQQAGTIDLGDAFPGLKRVIAAGVGLVAFFSTPVGAWLLVAIAWAILSTVNVSVGWGSTAEASGSLRRLACVAAGLGLLDVLPLTVWATLVACQSAIQVQGWLAAGVTLFSLAATVPMLQPPVRLRGTRQKLPRVEDEPFLKRITELASKMNVPVPIVRLWPSINGSQQAMAYVGCLPAPQLVVTDGILQRLAPAERDAVVAHELGHVANGSLWLLTAVIPVACAVAIGVSISCPLMLVVPFGIALAMGLRRIVSRPLELDADRRAARAIGFRETVAALAKIHAVNSFGKSDWLPLLLYATATHPSREVRLWSLQEAAPGGDLPEVKIGAATVRRHRTAARAALMLWLLILAGTLAVALGAPETPYLAAPLWMAILTPPALLLFAQWRQIAVARRRMGSRWIRNALLVVALLAFPVLSCFPKAIEYITAPLVWVQDSNLFLLYPLLLLGIWLASAAWMQRWQASRKLRGEMAIAFQVHDFHRVLEIGLTAPAVVARDPFLRYHIAFARAICADRSVAIAEFEELWRDEPGFPMTAITLGVLLLDADQPQRALNVAQSVALHLPQDSATHLLVARSLRRLGRLEEAQEACERALSLEPDGGKAHAVAAAIALDNGDFFRAQQLIDSALELAPGEVYVLLIHAEVVVKTQPYEHPRAAVEEALAVVGGNPFAFYRPDVTRLEQMLAEFEGARLVDELAAATSLD